VVRTLITTAETPGCGQAGSASKSQSHDV
jgi:hypothetical protein